MAAMSNTSDDKDDHDHDMVMPGFRFHPTEEELVEFYLRRKIEGKPFNVELITFLDLYRYDPWELPALAAIGEKEWFFYVPRDRKYRNGDRPNRVTTSGYWKATGADRMIRVENFRSIGLKKTLVFYSGKAPKGIRTSWIMNEYRLPQHETDRYQKVEISLCRVYKRAGVECHSQIPRSLSSGSSSSGGSHFSKKQVNRVNPSTTVSFQAMEENSQRTHIKNLLPDTHRRSNSSINGGSTLALSSAIPPLTSNLILSQPQEDETLLHHTKQMGLTNLFTCSSSSPVTSIDELHKLMDYQQAYTHQQQMQQFHHQQFLSLQSQPQLQSLALNTLPNMAPNFTDKMWEWNSIPEANRDYSSPYK